MISIAISTRNRPNEFWKVIKEIEEHTHCEYQLIVVDDASEPNYFKANYKFEERSGIPAAKNKCLELSKYDHIFLFDDDTYPISDDWWKPYLESGKNHLCYTFLPKYKVKDGFTYHTLGNGCMMYFTRKCLDVVGGFDWRFGLGKYEHANLSRRIFNAGLTEAPFMDVVGSEKLLYCLDQQKGHKRSFTREEMRQLFNLGAAHFRKSLNSKEYINFNKNELYIHRGQVGRPH